MSDRKHKMVRLNEEATDEVEEVSSAAGLTETEFVSGLITEYSAEYRQELAAALAGDSE